MTKFYTNVVCLGNYIFERGIENGLPFEERHEFNPPYTFLPQLKLNGEL